MLQMFRRAGRVGVVLALFMASLAASASSPATTTISDTVYRADGLPAAGTLLISWPSFTTAAGEPVAAGSMSVTLGTNGALTVALVPTVGATPAGTLYSVVYKLTDNTTATEFWAVGTSSPATIASVRTTPGSGTVSQMVSRQYLDSVVSAKANDTAVLHKGGSEVVDGVKEFSAPPTVPTPVLPSDAVNKEYVDDAVAAVGSGAYVNKGGDVMSGPLTLPGERNDVRRSAYDRVVNATIAVIVSAVIALHDHFGLK